MFLLKLITLAIGKYAMPKNDFYKIRLALLRKELEETKINAGIYQRSTILNKSEAKL